MHNTEVKTDIVIQQHQDQLPHHSQTSVSHGRRMTNGEGMVTGSSRHHRDGSLGMGTSSSSNECAGCGKRITDRFLLKALDLFWHEDCLKCGCCDCRLGEVGSTLYTKANLILCKRDYLRLFGNTGYCAACSKVIPAFEMVMRARNNVYHLECFACQQCNHRFCVGDRFYLCENKILCEYDYEERRVFANMACSPGNLDILRRQVSTFQQPGSQSEQQQQPQQQFNSSSSSIIVNNVINQYNQFDQQQHKYTLNVPFSKVPISEPLSIGSYSSTTISPPPSSSSDKHCSQAGYITKQTRVKERTDPFLILKSNPNLTSLPPSKRPKQSYSTYDNNNDNLDSAPLILYSERNNNHNFENIPKSLTFSTSPNFNPFLQSVRTADEHATNPCKTVKVHSSTVNSNYNAIGSPDSGIVEGP